MSDQMEKNWEAFIANKDELEAEHFGRVALLHDGELVSIYNDSGDAYDIGCERYGIGNFSVQTIGQKPISLGFLTMYL